MDKIKNILNKMRIVASLTTVPSRLLSLVPVIESIIKQTRPFDRIYLNVPKISKKGVSYPIDEFYQLINDANFPIDILCINIVDYDLGPIMKTLPTLYLETNPKTRIVSIDDDILISSTTCEMLEKYIKLYPMKALSLSGYIVGELPTKFEYVINRDQICSVDWILGVSLIVYKRNWINPLKMRDYGIIEDLTLRDYFIHNDDHWINYQLIKGGVERVVIPEKHSKYLLQSEVPTIEALSNNSGFLEENYKVAQYMKEQGFYNSPNINGILSLGALIIVIIIILLLFLFILLLAKLKIPLIIFIVVYLLILLKFFGFVKILGDMRYYLLVPVIMAISVYFLI